LSARYEYLLNLGQSPHSEIEDKRIGLSAERDFSNVILNMPYGMRAFLEDPNAPAS
jgi:hypothetical protein